MKTHLDDRLVRLAVKTGAAPDVGQAPAGHWEAGHLADTGAEHHPAQARHQTPQADKHLAWKH